MAKNVLTLRVSGRLVWIGTHHPTPRPLMLGPVASACPGCGPLLSSSSTTAAAPAPCFQCHHRRRRRASHHATRGRGGRSRNSEEQRRQRGRICSVALSSGVVFDPTPRSMSGAGVSKNQSSEWRTEPHGDPGLSRLGRGQRTKWPWYQTSNKGRRGLQLPTAVSWS
jgi:hypothetical protein